jgi:hypothetical protein
VKELDVAFFHRLYGLKKPRMQYQRGDFLDYVLMTLATAAVIWFVYGPGSPMATLGFALCAFMIITFVPRHGVLLRVPLILKRPQDILFMLIYKLQNMKPTWFIAAAVLLLENYVIYLTPDFPHHTELMRTIALWLFYIHFISVSAYRTVSLVDHLRKRQHVREVLLETNWKGLVAKRPSIALEIVHAYLTGVLTHMLLIAPWYVVITHVNFSILALPVVVVINAVVQLKFFKTFNDWFYRDHWLGHNSELEFLYLHGTHHDAIPTGLIGVAGNGHLEGFLRHVFGYVTPFLNPFMAFLLYTFEIKRDIDFHQYVPGVFPRLSRELHEINQHSMHHMGSLEPYGIGLLFDQPHVTEEFKKSTRLPPEILNSIRLDERLSGYKWDSNRYKNYLALVDKYEK